MQLQTLLSLLPLLSLTLATPLTDTTTKYNVQLDAYSTSTCAAKPDIKNLKFTTNDQCISFQKPEAGFVATSKKAVPDGCVLQVFADTACADVLAAITINAGCEAPLLGPALSAKLVGC
ncbi:MAG: hypothetical protein HETSPECPRED_003338 [Heterodermia speciosa]|uniref:Uncharacterized protein n=1 Tax=Heterodermia speciosa TaxID=116794 RepID=A0A8H3I495_9LECA|nr:MAG: hypothetical protein HETSPECPRED_003338 [Heterodermia speciosa]